MNALTLSAILSLILGITGSSNADLAKKAQQLQVTEQQKITQLLQELQGVQNDLGKGTVNSPTGQNLNHNETLVRDTVSMQAASEQNAWNIGEQSFSTSVLLSFLTYRIGGNCSPMVCGANHNETILRDTPVNQQANDRSLPTRAEESFSTSLLLSFSTYRIGGFCSPWVCGSNHNETMMSDRH